MSIAETFIRRPVASVLLSLGLLIAGAMAFDALPVAALPKVDFPVINVTARLPGADPETMAATVAAPLERRMGAIAGVTELTSTSNEGVSNTTLAAIKKMRKIPAPPFFKRAIMASRFNPPKTPIISTIK